MQLIVFGGEKRQPEIRLRSQATDCVKNRRNTEVTFSTRNTVTPNVPLSISSNLPIYFAQFLLDYTFFDSLYQIQDKFTFPECWFTCKICHLNTIIPVGMLHKGLRKSVGFCRVNGD